MTKDLKYAAALVILLNLYDYDPEVFDVIAKAVIETAPDNLNDAVHALLYDMTQISKKALELQYPSTKA